MGRLGRELATLDASLRQELLDLFTLSAAEYLDRWFESEPIKALFGFDGIVGNYASPYTPGSAYVLLHHVFGQCNGMKVRGAMRSVAWARSARPSPLPRGRPGLSCAWMPVCNAC